MERTRKILCLALLSLFLGLSAPASAQCGDDNPDCLLAPPQSQLIATHTTGGDLYTAPAGPLSPLSALEIEPIEFIEPVSLPAAAVDGVEPAPDFDHIDVRLRRQDAADISCGVQALGMALDTLDGSAPTSVVLLDYLLEHGYLYDFGTGVEELALVAREFGYAGSVAFHGWSFAQLQAELAAGRSVVVDLGANGADQPGHFVTVTGISPDGGWVAYSDPILGEQIATTAQFLELWNLQGDSGVAVASTPPAPPGPDFEAWTAAALAMMATLVLAPGMLGRRTRLGVGGALIADPGGTLPTTHIGMSPPYSAPAGKKWVQGDAFYETSARTELVYHEVEKKELRQVQVGTKLEKIPYTKRIQVDNGHWETTYKSEKYITGYRNKKILAYYKSQRYVRYYRTQRCWSPYGYYYKRVPVYGYRSVPVYETLKVPIYGTRQVPAGRVWAEKWETEEITAYRTVKKPVYEDRWVVVGVERIPEEVTVEEQVFKGYEWTLQADPALTTTEEGDLPAEGSSTNWDPFLENSGSNFSNKYAYLEAITIGEFTPELKRATGNMHLRAEPSAHSEHLAYITVGDLFYYTGATVYVNGTPWRSVVYTINGQEVHGWVVGGYQETVDPSELIVPDNSLDARNATLEYYWRHMSQTERQELIEKARSQVDAFRAEIQRINSNFRLSDPVREIVQEAAAVLLELPDWYVDGGIPASYFGRSTLTMEALQALQTLQSVSGLIASPPSGDTWALASAAYGVTQADMLLQLFGGASWPVGESTSAGEFPVRLFLTRKYGAWLRTSPDPDAANVSEAFLGVPQGERLTWNGEYSIGVNEEGARCVYYQLVWEYNNVTYSGWMPSTYLSPQLAHKDPYSERIYGDWLTTTFEYGDGADGWNAFHAGGARQNLNLYELFKSMRLPEEGYKQFPSVHHNLCGELAVMEALGISLEEGFARFLDLGKEFVDILINDTETNSSQLMKLIDAFNDHGWKGGATTTSINDTQDRLIGGEKVIALVTIDLNQSGVVSSSGSTDHWVEIREINLETDEVSYYNPYTNTVEPPVSVDQFETAWKKASGGSSMSIVTAQR